MTNLETLLREWAAIEPERCSWGLPVNGVDISVQTSGIWRTVLDDHGSEFHRIQPAAQEAIEARGWIWSVRGHSTHAVARVWLNIQSEDHEVTADTPAEAILSAYLQAMKAQ